MLAAPKVDYYHQEEFNTGVQLKIGEFKKFLSKIAVSNG